MNTKDSIELNKFFEKYNNSVDSLYKRLEENFYNTVKYNELPELFIFNKTHINNEIITKEFIVENKIQKEKLNNEIEKKYKEHIHYFFETLEKNFPYCNFYNLNRNIENLKINKYKFLDKFLDKLKRIDRLAYYNSEKNEMFIPNKMIDTIFHECLHMATTFMTSSETFCGFTIISYKEELTIGRYLNEGYTTLLTERFFTKTQKNILKKDSSYQLLKHLTLMLENIVGEEKMCKAYFNAKVIDLINEMSKYNTKTKSINFIKDLDYLPLYIYLSNRNKNKYDKKLETYILNIDIFLLESYMNKLIIEKETKTKEEAINKMEIYIEQLSQINIGKKNNKYYLEKISLDNYKENIINNYDKIIKKI